MIEFMCSK